MIAIRFLRAIDDAKLPHLREQMTRATKGLSAFMAVLLPVAWVIAIFARPDEWVSTTLHSFSLWLLTLYIHRTALADRVHPERLLFLLAVATITSGALVGLHTAGHHNEHLASTSLIVLTITAFFPWRPSLSLALVVPAAGMPLALGALLHFPLPLPLSTLLFSAIASCVASAIGAQLQRTLWLQLENARAQLVATERMSTLGRMTAGIAHELKTPLAAALNGLEQSKRLTAELRESIGHEGVTADDLREISRELDETVELQRGSLARATNFVLAIRAQTRTSNRAVCAEFDVRAQIDSVIALLQYRLQKSRMRVDSSAVPAQLHISGDPTKFDRILTNLVLNALDACDETAKGSIIRIACDVSAEGMLLSVHDDGPGVPETMRSHIFEPLFTTRGNTGGTGLGLHISKEIAESTFGGTLTLASKTDGARFELWCPRFGARAAQTTSWAPFATGTTTSP